MDFPHHHVPFRLYRSGHSPHHLVPVPNITVFIDDDDPAPSFGVPNAIHDAPWFILVSNLRCNDQQTVATNFGEIGLFNICKTSFLNDPSQSGPRAQELTWIILDPLANQSIRDYVFTMGDALDLDYESSLIFTVESCRFTVRPFWGPCVGNHFPFDDHLGVCRNQKIAGFTFHQLRGSPTPASRSFILHGPVSPIRDGWDRASRCQRK